MVVGAPWIFITAPDFAANAAKVLDLYARDGTGIRRARTGTDAAQLAADTWYAQEYS